MHPPPGTSIGDTDRDRRGAVATALLDRVPPAAATPPRRGGGPTSPWLLAAPEPTPTWVTAYGCVALLGAHGGAGVSTLAGLHPDLIPVTRWTRSEPRLVVVCRSNAAGIAAAGQLIASHRGEPLMGVAVVADAAGRLPGSLSRRLRLLESVAGTMWRIPWIQDCRLRGGVGTPPARVGYVLKQLVTVASRTTPAARLSSAGQTR